MDTTEQDKLNAALAAKLAPLVGEAAVYAETIYICSNGHINTRCTPNYEWGNECIECDGGARIDDSIQLPVDFADPAVLWPLWERWDTAHDWTVTIYREPSDGFEATIWQDEPGPYRKGTTVAEAVARAWAQALGLEGRGDE